MQPTKSFLSLLLLNCYPVFVLLALLLSLGDARLVFLMVVLFFLFVNFLVFKTTIRSFWRNTVERVLMFSGISILFSYALVTLDIPLWYSLSKTKAGLVLGLLTTLFLTNHIARHCDEKLDCKQYFWESQKDNPESWVKARTMIWWLGIIAFFAASVFGLAGEVLSWFDDNNGVIAFIGILLLSVGLLFSKKGEANHWVWEKSIQQLVFGVCLTLIGSYLTIRYEGVFIGYIGIPLFLWGIWLGQSESVKPSVTLDNVAEFKRVFFWPALGFWAFGIGVWYFANSQFRELTFPTYQQEAKKNLEKNGEKVEKRLIAIFDTLEMEGKLKRGYTPKILLSLTPDRDWLLQSRLHMEAAFTYDYKKGHLDTLSNYALGEYALEQSDIAQAIVNGFQLAIDNYLVNYFERGNDVDIVIEGTADATPFRLNSQSVYGGEYGDLENLVGFNRYDQKMKPFTILAGEKLNNENLAMLRGVGIRDFIGSNVQRLNKGRTTYNLEYFTDDKNIGGRHRKISIRLKINNLNPNLLN